MPLVRSRGATIYYEIRGTSGPPLVLLRGFGSSIRSWNGVDYDLGSDHLTIVLDNRGTGRSAAPAGTYQVGRMAEDVIAVMGHIGIPAAHVLGTSLGGMIAQELVLRFPRRVCSLVLAATSGGSVRRPPITARGTLTLAAAALLPARLRARLIARATLSLATRRKIAVSKACPAGWRMHTGTLAGLVGQAFALLAHRADSRLGQVAVPTLIIHGTSDELIDWCNALRLAELIPHARLETWQGAGHDLATEDPQRLAESVRRHVMGGGELQIED